MELNSLEDAYVKIAEDEIAAKEGTNNVQGEQTSTNNDENDFLLYSEAIGE